MKISDLDEYLHSDAIENGDVIEIVGDGHYVSSEDSTFGRAYLEIKVMLSNGKTKVWTPNKTTLRKLAEAFGDETSEWLGKQVKLSKIKQNVRGKMVDVIYGEAHVQSSKEQLQPSLQ